MNPLMTAVGSPGDVVGQNTSEALIEVSRRSDIAVSNPPSTAMPMTVEGIPLPNILKKAAAVFQCSAVDARLWVVS